MATALDPAAKEKKKGGLRTRFLNMTQAISLDTGSTAVSSTSTQGETESVEGIRLGTTSPPNGSRVKRMLFRRARSETTDEERTRQFRFNKTEGSSATTGVTSAISPRLGSSHNQQNPFSVEAAPVHRFLNPQSPPPPYDTPTETDSVRSVSACPPSYEEAMAQNGPNDTREPYCPSRWAGRDPLMSATPLSPYCTCRECQERYMQAEEEHTQDDSCADAVLPMETHVLMQEVLADGMAFCSLM